MTAMKRKHIQEMLLELGGLHKKGWGKKAETPEETGRNMYNAAMESWWFPVDENEQRAFLLGVLQGLVYGEPDEDPLQKHENNI